MPYNNIGAAETIVHIENNDIDNNKAITSAAEENNENNEPKFHSIACVNCRSIHKKCSKHLPSCMECLKRGKICSYRTPKKKGRTKGSKNKPLYEIELTMSPPPTSSSSSGSSGNNITTNTQQKTAKKKKKQNKKNKATEPYPVPIVFTNNNISNNNVNNNEENNIIDLNLTTLQTPAIRQNQHFVNTFIKTRTVDAYFDIVSLGRTIFKKEEMRHIIFEDFSNLDPRLKAVLFSIQAVTDQRMGQTQTAEICFKEAKQYLRTEFDAMNDFFVRASYGLLGLYAAGEGDDLHGNFFLHSLKYFHENLLNTENMTEGDQVVRELYCKASICSRFKDVEDLSSLWNGLKEFVLMKGGVQIPNEFDEALKSGLTMETLPIILRLNQVLKQYCAMDNSVNPFTNEQHQIVHVIKDIVFDAVNIAVFMATGFDGKEVDVLVDSVIEATTRDFFIYCPVAIVHFVSMVANFVVKRFNSVQSRLICGEITPKDLHYFQQVSKLLRAYKVMSDRYKRVEKMYSVIIRKLEAISSVGSQYFNYFQ
ncbi:hypothetical protein ABK040_001312 [Willaertia magna]